MAVRLKSYENTESAGEVQIFGVSSKELVNLKVQSSEFHQSEQMQKMAEELNVVSDRDHRGMEGCREQLSKQLRSHFDLSMHKSSEGHKQKFIHFSKESEIRDLKTRRRVEEDRKHEIVRIMKSRKTLHFTVFLQ